jgi:cell fate regulator YaaT (PSP1 superfamily)
MSEPGSASAPTAEDRERDGAGGPPPRRHEARKEARRIVGARLHPHGRTLEFEAGELELSPGDRIVVDDRRGGTEVAVVSVAAAIRVPRGPAARVIRRAEARDVQRLEAREAKSAEALAFARERVRARELPMKVFRVEATPERMLFYFSSDQRVDFRELVKELAGRFRGRIEMRQVGVRDEAKMVGGIGSCGRELCCTTFLQGFAPVSIRSAKNQNLVLNPSKISGQCGRLKCCLVYEEAQYVEAGKKLPKLGKRVETPEGMGRVDDLDILAGKIRVSFPDRPPMTFEAGEVRAIVQGGARSPEPAPPGEPGPDGEAPGE